MLSNGHDPRILVFRTGQLGDMIISLPAMWAMRNLWPGAHLTLLSDVHPGQNYVIGSQIFQGAGIFDDFIHYEVPADSDGIVARAIKKFELLRRLRSARFSTLVYLAASIRPRPLVERDRRFFKAAGVRQFYGMDHFPPVPAKDSPRPMPKAGHEADLILARLRADGLTMPAPGEGSLDLHLGAPEQAEFEKWLARERTKGLEGLRDQGTKGPRDRGTTGRLPDGQDSLLVPWSCGPVVPPFVAFGPGSKMPAKRWPLDRFAQVGHALIDQFDIFPIVFGGAEDSPHAKHLLETWGRGYNAAGQLSLRGAAYAMGRCAFYVGNDSGAMHLAAAAGTPCVAVFSSRDWPGAWYPYGVRHQILRSDIDCEGCYLTECLERKNECLNRITVPQVLAACEAVLEERRMEQVERRT